MAGIVLTARKLETGDICITANSYETNTLLEHVERWTEVDGGQTKV
jgi:hypothetical protein